ncbi:MAG: phage tail tape measure protein [Bacteroidales bacterium]|nr:phage tail tape measure protein [Bacteroidales bacterium]
MAENLTFSINIGGNVYKGILQLDTALANLNITANSTDNIFSKLTTKCHDLAFKVNNITSYLRDWSSTLNEVNTPAIALNSSLADLSAIAGVTGSKLKEIEGYARKNAKTFGGSAADAVESYKLLLSQLSPTLADAPQAMQLMGENISILSKTMGGDTIAAAETLTTAMNQYGISLDNPMEASRKMAEMMNVMAAAANEGSAELPQIKQALEQAGMMAKSAGVSFSETNAAIQVLDKAGKKGAEGGVALRNVMSILSQGRFLPKVVLEELQTAGVDVDTLTDKTKTLTERLRPMQTIMNDSALFVKTFGRENSAAAMALVQNIDEIARLDTAITGTNTAYEQADIIMDSYAEKQARINARIDDIKISLFSLTGNLGILANVASSVLIPFAQMMPLFSGLYNVISNNWDNIVNVSKIGYKTIIKHLTRMQIAATFTGGYFNLMALEIKGACKIISSAIKSIPIIGWILAGISAIISIFKLLWDKCENFRILCFVIWEVIKGIFSKIGDLFSWLWDKITVIASMVAKPFIAIYEWIKGLFSKIINWISEKIGKLLEWIKKLLPKDWFDKGVAAGRESWNKDHPDNGITPAGLPGMEGLPDMNTSSSKVPHNVSSGVESAVSGGTRNTQITINLGKMIENIVFNGGYAENKQAMTREIEEAVARILYMATTTA